MFQPGGVKTLLQMRSQLPPRPSTSPPRPDTISEEAASQSEDCGPECQDLHRAATAPPSVGPRTMGLHERVDEDRQVEDCREDLGSVLQEASSVLQQLQNGWREERQDEISRLWSQCEAEYGFVLSQTAPGTPALGSLRARAGNGAAGLLDYHSGYPPAAVEAPHREEPPAVAESLAEVEAEAAMEAARKDLEAVRELRRSIEMKFAAKSEEAAKASNAQALQQRRAGQIEVESPRLASLRMEVESLRAKAAGMSTVGTNTPAATAAIDASELTAPDVEALDDWMEDLRMLCHEAGQDLQQPSPSRREQGRAVASPMRTSNGGGFRSPTILLSPTSSPSKKDMALLAERNALQWAAGQHSARNRASPRLKSGQNSPSRTPKKPLLSSRGGLLGAGHPTAELSPTSREPTSTVERQLDDILNELDEIDRIHDDVCMLAHS